MDEQIDENMASRFSRGFYFSVESKLTTELNKAQVVQLDQEVSVTTGSS